MAAFLVMAGDDQEPTPAYPSLICQLLFALLLETLTPVAVLPATLIRLGCPKPVRLCALLRGGISRSVDAEPLAALEPAYELRAEAHTCIELPETSGTKLALMARVELTPALLFGALRLR